MSHQNQENVDRRVIEALVVTCLRDVTARLGHLAPNGIDATTVMNGAGGTAGVSLDSLALITLLIDLEQRLAADLGIAITLADEQSLWQTSATFRSVEAVASHVLDRITHSSGAIG